MSDKAKRGSIGGNKRAESLSKEQRKAIASAAAKARWDKKRNEKAGEAPAETIISLPPVQTIIVPDTAPTFTNQALQFAPAPKPQKPKRIKQPKPFGVASNYAEKRLAEAIRERGECAGRLAALNAEIPSLVQIIQALKSTEGFVPARVDPRLYQTEPVNYSAPYVAPPVSQAAMPGIPPIPMAQGGAVGGPVSAESVEMPEDYFLRDSVVGGEFR